MTWFYLGAALYRHFKRETPFFVLGSLTPGEIVLKNLSSSRWFGFSEPLKPANRVVSGIATHVSCSDAASPHATAP